MYQQLTEQIQTV